MASDTKASLSEEEMQQVYAWVDEIPLTRPKRNIARDFSDGVMTAELVKHFFPKMVELHNYSTANSVTHKLYNWNTLNQKVFKKLNFSLTRAEIDGVCNCAPGIIERVLYTLKTRLDARLQRKAEKGSATPERPSLSQLPPAINPSMLHSPASPPQSQKAAPVPYLPQQPLPPNGPSSLQSHMSPSLGSKGQGHKQSHPQPIHHTPTMPNQQQPSTTYYPHQSSPQQQHIPQQQQQQFNPGFYDGRSQAASDPQVASLLEKKDQTISELHAHVENLESRLMKMEQILRIKDSKIQKLTAKLQQAGLQP